MGADRTRKAKTYHEAKFLASWILSTTMLGHTSHKKILQKLNELG